MTYAAPVLIGVITQLLEGWAALETGYRIPKRMVVVGYFLFWADTYIDPGPRMLMTNLSENRHLPQPKKSDRTNESRFSKNQH